MPEDIGKILGEAKIEIGKKGIIVLFRKEGSEIWKNEENIVVDNLEDFIINKSNKDEIDDAETLEAINKEVEEIERKIADEKKQKIMAR